MEAETYFSANIRRDAIFQSVPTFLSTISKGSLDTASTIATSGVRNRTLVILIRAMLMLVPPGIQVASPHGSLEMTISPGSSRLPHVSHHTEGQTTGNTKCDRAEQLALIVEVGGE